MRVLVLQHAADEGAGLVGAALAEGGAVLDVRGAWRGDALPATTAGYDLVLALGGPMSAWEDAAHPWLAREAALLAEAAREGRPTLGICLGAQLLARGLGARVERGARPELGLLPIALTEAGRADALAGALDGAPVLQWHFDTFALPDGAVRLASSAAYENQAFRAGAAAWGVQFHPECDLSMRADWARRDADLLRRHGVDPAALSAPATAAVDARGHAFARALVEFVSARVT